MERYNHEYTQKEDFALWQLHEIRHSMACENLTPQQINERGIQVIKEHRLTKLKIVNMETIEAAGLES